MTMNHHFLEQNDVINGFGAAAPSGSTVQRFSMKNYQRASVFIFQNKSAGNGSAIALKQCKEIDDNPVTEKVLEMTKAYRSLANGTQAAPVNTWAEFVVISNTFTTDATNSVRDAYMIDIKAEDLDIDLGFDIVEVEIGNAASNIIQVVILLHKPKNGRFPNDSGIVD